MLAENIVICLLLCLVVCLCVSRDSLLSLIMIYFFLSMCFDSLSIIFLSAVYKQTVLKVHIYAKLCSHFTNGACSTSHTAPVCCRMEQHLLHTMTGRPPSKLQEESWTVKSFYGCRVVKYAIDILWHYHEAVSAYVKEPPQLQYPTILLNSIFHYVSRVPISSLTIQKALHWQNAWKWIIPHGETYVRLSFPFLPIQLNYWYKSQNFFSLCNVDYLCMCLKTKQHCKTLRQTLKERERERDGVWIFTVS